MVTEDFVGFEAAKLLKEKGFNCLCHSYFRNNPNNLIKESCGANWNGEPFFISRPTLQMAMKWLREVHNLNCEICYDYELRWYWQVKSLTEVLEGDYPEMKIWHPNRGEHQDIGFNAYENACESAIKYCLENLI